MEQNLIKTVAIIGLGVLRILLDTPVNQELFKTIKGIESSYK